MKPLQLESAKILVRVPNWIGDAVMCLPALRELRRVLPQADLTLLARPWVLDIFPAAELHCRSITYDTQREHGGWLGRWRLVSSLRGEKFGAAILFQNAFDAAMVTTLAGIPIRAGYARQGRGPLLTHPVEVPRPGETPPHETYYYLELLRRLGLLSALPEIEEIRLRAAQPDRNAARRRLRERIRERKPGAADAKLLMGIGAGASFGTAKRWPTERFAELAAQLSAQLDAACVFFGSPEEQPLIETLLPDAGEGAVSLAGATTLQDFMRLIAACDLFITNDTGTMHVAAALGVPVLAIFGPTDEQGTRPLGPLAQVITGQAECRPCKLRHCPIDHRCMTSIPVTAVLQAARNIIQSRDPETADRKGVVAQ